MTYLIERCRGYFDKYFHFEPTKPLELNESDGLWTVSVQSSFGQISLPQDSLKKVFDPSRRNFTVLSLNLTYQS